jgi:Uncharacterized conserved protein
MPTDDAWLKDMLSAGREAASLTTGFNYDQFAADRTLQLAGMHLIVIIGEAAAQGSDETPSALYHSALARHCRDA